MHHGFKGKWIPECIPFVRHVTLMREPVSLAISFLVFQEAVTYYRKYPLSPCAQKGTFELDSTLRRHSHKQLLAIMANRTGICFDVPLRRNMTMQLVAQMLDGYKKGPAEGALNHHNQWMFSYVWMLNHDQLAITNSSHVVDFLQQNYFLVGVTEHINTFLVLLALHMGWDLEKLYYVKCKGTDVRLSPKDLDQNFPLVMQRLREKTRVHAEVYNRVKNFFTIQVKKLDARFEGGPGGLSALVTQFEKGLKAFQQSKKTPALPWTWYAYKDGHNEDC
jgi:hypothetical protein